jgi:hypothetical protein
MTEPTWEDIAVFQNELQANLVNGLLQAQGIITLLNQEGAGRAYGLTLGRLGGIHLLVPQHQASQALQVLADYEAGAYANQNLAEPNQDEFIEYDEGEL